MSVRKRNLYSLEQDVLLQIKKILWFKIDKIMFF